MMKLMRIKSYLTNKWKSNKTLIIKVSLVSLIIFYVILSSTYFKSIAPDDVSKKRNLVFLLDSNESILKPIEIDSKTVQEFNDVNETVASVLEILKTGYPQNSYLPTIPTGIIGNYFRVENRHVIISFNKEFYNMEELTQAYLRSSVIRSLTSFDLIDSVEFFVNGVPLRDNEGKTYGRQYADDVILSYDEATLSKAYKMVTFYYPNEKKDKLVPTYENILISPNEKLEEIIVNILLDKKINSILPADTKLLNIYTNEGICFVDLSKECQTNYLPRGISERIAIYSMVNSLTELPHITNVQILVEGQIERTFQGNLLLNRMFSKNYALNVSK